MQIAQVAVRQAAQDAVRQVAQEVARVAAQEGARVAPQEVAHQMGRSVQQAQQQAPPVVVQGAELLEELRMYRERFSGQMGGEQAVEDVRPVIHEHADHERFPPPAPVRVREGPSYWELMRQMKDMGLDRFGEVVDTTVADNWRRQLERNLDHMRCPTEYSLDLATQYLRDDALAWWEAVVEGARGRYELTFDDFKREFTKKYFPREAMDEKENAFQDLRQGSMTVREYELEFSRLCRILG